MLGLRIQMRTGGVFDMYKTPILLLIIKHVLSDIIIESEHIQSAPPEKSQKDNIIRFWKEDSKLRVVHLMHVGEAVYVSGP